MAEIIAYCGLVCDECPAFMATQANDVERLTRIASEWSGEEMSFQPDDIRCHGCLPGGERVFSWSNACGIRQCCMERGLANCACCHDLPCDTLDNAPPGTIDRLLRMRDEPHPSA